MAQIDWKAACAPVRVARLSNGLAVVAHRDARSPLVAVYVAYRAGSREEPESRAGLAHLCEHLMFTGTPAAPGSYFAPFERIGAAWMNAYVREDYSAYFATVPAWALDFALRMEADRMAHLAAALDDEKIARQREIVRNELRQRAGDRYGRVPAAIAGLAHRPGHPYAHPPDGVLKELDNISADDVRDWIEMRHCAGNAAVVIAGDVDPDSAIDMVRRHFESLPGGRGLGGGAGDANPAIEGVPRGVIDEQGEQARLYVAWNGPRFASSDHAAYELACEVLGGGKASRLWSALERQRLALDVTFQTRPREFGSQAVLATTARPSVPLAVVEAAAEREVEEFARDGANPVEVDAARLRVFARLVRGLQRVGGPQSKSDALGVATMLAGDPRAHDEWIAAFATAEPEAVAAAACRWLGRNRAVVEVRAAARGITA